MRMRHSLGGKDGRPEDGGAKSRVQGGRGREVDVVAEKPGEGLLEGEELEHADARLG